MCIAILAAGAAVAAGAGGLIGSDGRIYACASKKDGHLRVVKKGKRCKRTETAISWNQDGRTGARGAPGPNGVPGGSGPAGSNGTPGAPGSPGVAASTPTPAPELTDPTATAMTLSVNGAPQIPVRRFGGCRDLTSGPEPCFLEIQVPAMMPLAGWISETAQGGSPRRNVRVRASSQGGSPTPLPGLQLNEATVTSVSFGTFDGASSEPLSITLVLQPASIAETAAEAPTFEGGPPTSARSYFRLSVTGLPSANATATVGPIGFSAAGGAVSFQPMKLTSVASQNLDEEWDAWVAEGGAPRTATLEVLNASFTTVVARLTFPLSPTASSNRYPVGTSPRAILEGTLKGLTIDLP